MSDKNENEKKSSLDILYGNNDVEIDEVKKDNMEKEVNKVEEKEIKNNAEVENNKVVPAYMNNNNNTSKTTKKINTKTRDKKKIKSRITLILILVIIAIIVFFVYNIISSKIKRTNINYETYIYNFGLNKMYTNESAKSEEEVTKLEALKLIMNSSLNTDDLSDYYYGQIETYEGEFWVKSAINSGVIGSSEINKDNYNEKVKYLDVVNWLGRAKQKLLNKALSTSNKKIKIEGYDMYSSVTQSSIADLIESNILENENINLDTNITKGELNKLIIEYVIVNNTLTLDNQKINISKEKAPSNEAEYPYILFGVDKETYEIKNYIKNETNYLNPLQAFGDLRTHYTLLQNKLEGYYNYILNVDYNTVNEAEFNEKIQDYSLYTTSDELISNYVAYLKSHKIKLSGSAKVQFPILYFDGENYRARLKLEYKVESSDTEYDLLFGDTLDSQNDIYNNKKDEIFIDAPFSLSKSNNVFYIKTIKINDNISGNVK